jgi:arylsulfatase A-like enzyme
MRISPWISAFAWVLSFLGAQSPPNLLVVIVDDLGPEYVRCYQQQANPPATPNIDQLAAQGVRFANAYANPVCTPTRACLMTGRHAFRSGMEVTCMQGDAGLRDDEWILPEAMGSRGYARALIGKWHLGDRHGPSTPNVQGWPHFVGALYGNLPNYTQWQKTANGTSIQATTYATTDQVDEALAWIGAQTRPWLLVLSFHAPHTPLHAPPAHLHGQNLAGLNPATSPIPFYKAMVEALDAEFGRLMTGLGAARSRTNVLLLSDNGAPSAVAIAPPTRAKGSLYEGGVRIPMIAQGPAVTNPGRLIVDRVHVVDVFPTLWELAGGAHANVPVALDGVSFAPLLADQPQAERPIYAETIGTGFGSGCTQIDGDYKLVRFFDDPVMEPHEELYNLRTDPYEQSDLIAGPSNVADQLAYHSLAGRLWSLRPKGHIQRFGSDCATTDGSVRIKSYAPPTLGAAHHMRVLSPGVGATTLTFPTVVYVGFDDTQWNGATLPTPLTAYGMPGCSLYVRPDVVAYAGTTSVLFWIGLPADPVFAGTQAFAQAFVLDPGANAAGIAASAGYRFTLGF